MWREPWFWIIIAVVLLLLFGAPKLPAFAKSLGQSMRIFRKEVKTLKDERAADGGADAAKSEDIADSAPLKVSAEATDDAKPAV